MWHLSQEYITGSFLKIEERFDALEQRLTHQTRGLENHTDAKIKPLEERISQKLDAILELLDARQEVETVEEQVREPRLTNSL